MPQGKQPIGWPDDKIKVASNSNEIYDEDAIEHHGRPSVARDNINDEAFRNPPQNRELGIQPGVKQRTQRGIFPEVAQKDRRAQPVRKEAEVLGTEQLMGREKEVDDLAEAVENNSVHS